MAIAAATNSVATLAMKPNPAMTRRTAMRITVWKALLSKRPDAILLHILVAIHNSWFKEYKNLYLYLVVEPYITAPRIVAMIMVHIWSWGTVRPVSISAVIMPSASAAFRR